MNKRNLILVCVFLLLGASFLHARGHKETVPEKKIVQITGTVRLVGTALFPEIVISASDGQWVIAQDEIDKLHAFQHQTVTVEGEETVTELKFASGASAGMRRELKNVVILSINMAHEQ